jgi:hypothetical protein
MDNEMCNHKDEMVVFGLEEGVVEFLDVLVWVGLDLDLENCLLGEKRGEGEFGEERGLQGAFVIKSAGWDEEGFEEVLEKVKVFYRL